MKPPSLPNDRVVRATTPTPPTFRSVSERGVPHTAARPPPAAHRRYPSLSDSGLPCFPRFRRAPHDPEIPRRAPYPAAHDTLPPFPTVRAIALIALVVIVVALVANA